MNADYIKAVVDKANELITLIESAYLNHKLQPEDTREWKRYKEGAITLVRQAAATAIKAETLN